MPNFFEETAQKLTEEADRQAIDRRADEIRAKKSDFLTEPDRRKEELISGQENQRNSEVEHRLEEVEEYAHEHHNYSLLETYDIPNDVLHEVVDKSHDATKDLPLMVSTVHGTPQIAYGACYGSEIAWSQVGAVEDTWYIISDTDIVDGSGGLYLVSHDGSGKLTVLKPGKYLVNYTISMEDNQTNDHVLSGLSVDGTPIIDGRAHWDSVANKEVVMAGTAIISLALNSYVEVAVAATDANSPTLTVDHINLTIVWVGA